MTKKKADRVWVGYIRVSTREQADSGLSLEAQRDKVMATAQARGVTLAEVLTDAAESGKDLKRPAAQRIVDLAQGKLLAGVIIAKLDRLTRSVYDLAFLVRLFNRNDVALVSAAEWLDTGSAAGRMVLSVVTAMAEMEREQIGERTSAALQAKLKRGEPAGNVRYGWRYVGKNEPVVEDAHEQMILGWIQAARAEGRSLRAIADELNTRGHKTRSGSPWKFQYVANVLRMAESRAVAS